MAWTPGRRDFAGLVALLGGDDKAVRTRALAALVRAGTAARDYLLREVPRAQPPVRGRVVRALAPFCELPGSEALRAALGGLLDDDDLRTRRAAAAGLSRFPGAESEAQLIAAWARFPDAATRRSLAEALGKVGGPRARALLAAPGAVVARDGAVDAELGRLRDEAILRLARAAGRGGLSRIDAERSPPAPLAVRLHCRAGVEEILLEECPASWRARLRGPGLVDATLAGPLSSLFTVRTATRFGFPLPIDPPTAEVEGVAAVVGGPAAAAIAAAFTEGEVRYRLDFAGGGKHRALVHRLAEAVAARQPAWVNDPSERCWELHLADRGEAEGGPRFVGVELEPRLADPRFAWRVADVPAASHPTLAAALARVAGVRPDDVVWDPFVGSASELIERACLGPFARLIGSDLSPEALAAAGQNLAAAGLTDVELRQADALAGAPAGVTLVLCNPPMGRRVQRHAELKLQLERFVELVAGALVPGGRLVWISPHGARSAEVARRVGLDVELRRQVDMGGFPAELQRLVRPLPPTRRTKPPRRT